MDQGTSCRSNKEGRSRNGGNGLRLQHDLSYKQYSSIITLTDDVHIWHKLMQSLDRRSCSCEAIPQYERTWVRNAFRLAMFQLHLPAFAYACNKGYPCVVSCKPLLASTIEHGVNCCDTFLRAVAHNSAASVTSFSQILQKVAEVILLQEVKGPDPGLDIAFDQHSIFKNEPIKYLSRQSPLDTSRASTVIGVWTESQAIAAPCIPNSIVGLRKVP
jgi:hypothetical protein